MFERRNKNPNKILYKRKRNKYDIVEINNIKDDDKSDDRQKTEEIEKKYDIQEANKTKINEINKNDSNGDEMSKNSNNILSEKYEENNNKIEKKSIGKNW